MNDYVIVAEKLTRYYGRKPTVNMLNLRIPRGSIFGFLGRNGAGKTTTIRMLLGLVEPTRGEASILGCPCRSLTPEVRARIGYLPEGHHVYGWMSVQECGKFQSSFFKTWNEKVFQATLDYFRLAPKMSAGVLSRGQRAGLCLALTLAPEPELLILDDPALGLDPLARRNLLESMLYVTRRADRTIFFSSHMLSDVERVADRIAIMDDGVVRADCTIDTFRSRLRRFLLKYKGPTPALTPQPCLIETVRLEREIAVTLTRFDSQIQQWLEDQHPDQIEEIQLNLEDAFVSYVGDHQERRFFLQGVGE